MFLELAAGGYLVAQYVYHRLTDDKKPYIHRDRNVRFQIPDEGSRFPMIFGRTLVHSPMIVWCRAYDGPVYTSGNSPNAVDLTMVIGIPIVGGATHLKAIWYDDTIGRFGAGGEAEYPLTFPPNIAGLTYVTRTPKRPMENAPYNEPPLFAAYVEFGDGRLDQSTDPSYLRNSWIAGNADDPPATVPAIDPDLISGLRGYAFLHLHQGELQGTALPQMSVEISSYAPFPTSSVRSPIGDDMNPVDVLIELLRGEYEHTSVPYIDYPSFYAAGTVLKQEGNGYSGCVTGTVEDLVADVLRQIDGILRESPRTGKLELKLVRADYNPSSLRTISPDNCEALDGFAIGSWSAVPNSVRVTFTNRDNAYLDGTAMAHNLANAYSASSARARTNDIEVHFAGCHTQANANNLAARELSARSRPLMKCRAIVSRAFWDTMPGDVLRLSWPEYNIANILMRVGAVNRGDDNSNSIALDLIQEYFYVRPSSGLPVEPPVGPFPGGAGGAGVLIE